MERHPARGQIPGCRLISAVIHKDTALPLTLWLISALIPAPLAPLKQVTTRPTQSRTSGWA